MDAQVSQGKQTFQRRLTGFSNRRFDSASKTRPKTAYRPMTGKIPSRRKDTILSDQSKHVQKSPYMNTITNEPFLGLQKHQKDMRTSIQSVLEPKQTNKTYGSRMQKRHAAMRASSKTHQKEKIGYFRVNWQGLYILEH